MHSQEVGSQSQDSSSLLDAEDSQLLSKLQRSKTRKKQPAGGASDFKGALNFAGVLGGSGGTFCAFLGSPRHTNSAALRCARPTPRRPSHAATPTGLVCAASKGAPRPGGFARSTSWVGRAGSAGAGGPAMASAHPQTVSQKRFVFGEDSSSRSAWSNHASGASNQGSSQDSQSPRVGAGGLAAASAAADSGKQSGRMRLFATAVMASNRFSNSTKKDSSKPALRRQQTA